MTTTTVDTPRIYAACLASYNAGKLHGAWIDADQDAEDIASEVAAMLRASTQPNVTVECPECEGAKRSNFGHPFPCPSCKGSGKVPSAEEWVVHDIDGGMVDLGETSDVNAISLHGQAVAEHGDAWEAFAENIGAEYATLEGFEEAYCGEHDSEKDYAYDLLDSMGEVKDNGSLASQYFDYEAFTRDLFISDYFSMPLAGRVGVHVFRNI